MTEARRRDEWDRTSHLLACIENSQKTKRDKPTSPAERNPFLVAKAKANRPKIKDVGFLARMMGLEVEDDEVRRKRREERKRKKAEGA